MKMKKGGIIPLLDSMMIFPSKGGRGGRLLSLHIRVPKLLLDRMAAILDVRSRQEPAANFNLSDVARMALARGLEAMEEEIENRTDEPTA